jgi:Dissimilatory sulfite reductase (desulfoviridin), alpha and beta subunits
MADKALVINPEWCKGCGICAAFCPKGALELVGEKVRLRPENDCVLCGICEQHCPDYAIWLKEEEA